MSVYVFRRMMSYFENRINLARIILEGLRNIVNNRYEHLFYMAGIEEIEYAKRTERRKIAEYKVRQGST